MVKFIMTLLMAAAMVMSGAAFALNPSIQVGDLTMVGIVQPEGVTLGSDFAVATDEETDFSLWLFESISEYLDDTDVNHTIDYFPPETIMGISELLPMGTDLDSLQITEFLPLNIANYDEAYGDIDLIFGFPTVYDIDDSVVSVLAYKVDDHTEYMVLYTDVREDGSIEVMFPIDALRAAMEHDAALMVIKAE